MKLKIYFLFTFLTFLFFSNTAYSSREDIKFQSGDITIAGTLLLPKGDGPFPAIVFVHGSGPETRDNSLYSAKWLKKIGYAVLIYDKRGTGESEGDLESVNRFSIDDLSDDAVAALNYLAQMDKIDKERLGIHASSQGGWVASMVLSKTSLIDFMIIKSASVCTIGEDRLYERSERLKKEGFSDESIAESQKIQLVEGKRDSSLNKEDEFSRLFNEYKENSWFERVYGKTTNPFGQELTQYRLWYAGIVDFDPLPFLEKSQIPIFWIFGDPKLDISGPVSLSIKNLEILRQKGKAYKIVQIDGQSHNIKEKKYERKLYDWLCEVNNYHTYKFKKH